MTDRANGLDARLAEWAARTLPEPFPALDEVLGGPDVLGPAYWRVMRRIWSGSTWRPHLDPWRGRDTRTVG